MKVILFGAPGCGKGTQAVKICEKYGFPHISTGDIFRENIKNNSPLGMKVKKIIDNGGLCPDDLTIELVKDRLNKKDCQKNYLLDGFPRNIIQAQALDEFNSPDIVIDIEVDFALIEKRITGRRNCTKCNGTFHTDSIGNTTVCPVCGGTLNIRADDNVDTVKERLLVYERQTLPLQNYYLKQKKLFKINGNNAVSEVFSDIEKLL